MNAVAALICIVLGCALGALTLHVLMTLGDYHLRRREAEWAQAQRLEAAVAGLSNVEGSRSDTADTEARLSTVERKLQLLEGDGR